MCRLIRSLALVVLLSPAAILAAPTDTVYVTPHGEKYHKKDCQYASMKSTALTVESAKARGLDPCKKCRPPK